MKLSPQARKHLHRRLSLALYWDTAAQHEKELVWRRATACIEAIEESATSASTMKRTVARLSERIERTA